MITKSVVYTALLIAGLASAANAQSSSPSFLAPLAGEDGGKVELNWDRFPDDSGGSLKTEGAPDGGIGRMEIIGLVHLDSPKLTLKSDYLLYEQASNLLIAEGNVEVLREGIEATCDKLTFDLATEDILMTGLPIVDQETESNAFSFRGMEELRITPLENGDKELLLNGGDTIFCNIITKSEDGTSTATETVATPAPTQDSSDGGMNSMGDNIKITTRATTLQEPRVSILAGGEGGIRTFEAVGSVYLESEDMDLRTDRLIYEAEKEAMHALGNVFITQEGLEADSREMFYNLATGRIELTGDPDIRQDQGNQIMRISDIAAFLINRNPDGSFDTEVIPGPGAPGKTEFLPKAPPTPVPGEATNGPVQIDLNNPEDLDKIK